MASALVALPRPKVQTEIALRNVAAAAAHFLDLLMFAGTDRHPCADAVAIRFGACRASIIQFP